MKKAINIVDIRANSNKFHHDKHSMVIYTNYITANNNYLIVEAKKFYVENSRFHFEKKLITINMIQ